MKTSAICLYLVECENSSNHLSHWSPKLSLKRKKCKKKKKKKSIKPQNWTKLIKIVRSHELSFSLPLSLSFIPSFSFFFHVIGKHMICIICRYTITSTIKSKHVKTLKFVRLCRVDRSFLSSGSSFFLYEHTRYSIIIHIAAAL